MRRVVQGLQVSGVTFCAGSSLERMDCLFSGTMGTQRWMLELARKTWLVLRLRLVILCNLGVALCSFAKPVVKCSATAVWSSS